MPARFTEDSGQKVLIEAIKRLERSDVFCLLLGSIGAPTPFEKELEHAIERAELHGRVQIGPYVEDMPAAYMLADVVVATGGASQGFSRTLVEAQAMGRPVVAEDGGGAAEAVRPGVTGWLAPAGDPAALAEAISQALSLSAERRAELARAAQEHVRGRFALAHSNQQLLQLYERLSGLRMRACRRLLHYSSPAVPCRWRLRGPPSPSLPADTARPAAVGQRSWRRHRAMRPTFLGDWNLTWDGHVDSKCPCHGRLTIGSQAERRPRRLLAITKGPQRRSSTDPGGVRPERLDRPLRPARLRRRFPLKGPFPAGGARRRPRSPAPTSPTARPFRRWTATRQ